MPRPIPLPSTLSTAALAATLILLSGCSALTSTTNTAAEAAQTIANGISKASRASTNASVTEPDTPRYAQAVAFVDSQGDALRREAASGGGEHVDALAILLTDDNADFGPWLQRHYDRVFAEPDQARGIVDRIIARRG
ncbi:DUF3015 family protein [Salinisphaera sp. T31B1]|uniref:DUF3015 family protein n=1 Tax=Salinisphaera sp. T31B1 TaxID=727963 RepID=UPI0033415368